jgi:hypothetical protein
MHNIDQTLAAGKSSNFDIVDPPPPTVQIGSSENLSLLEDVLPSFEMHNYMFNRTIYDTENINSLDQPPNYDDLTSLNTENHPQLDSNNFVDPTKNPNVLLLNNLEKFQKIDLPIQIQIILTKSVPKVGFNSERENPLRQYKPGEVVCGYILIENKSDEPIPFEMLLVSLEGETTIPNPLNPDELIRKKFLKTYDLSACFHYGCIDLESQNVSYEHLLDEVDKTTIGFASGRMIKPKTKHKKMFTFKLPHYLLDNSCFDQLSSHLKLPPSFGVDNQAFNGLAKHIKINPVLGYGRLDRYGSPIKTSDYSLDGQSVSYFINVSFIGRKLEFYKKFYTHETKHEYDFIFLKNIEYHFRVDTSTLSFLNEIPLIENPFGDIPTNEQLKIIENLITDKLNEILERKNLKQIGITDIKKQDEIIFSNLSNSKKDSQLSVSRNNSSSLMSTISDTKTSLMDDNGFSRYKKLTLVKDFFSKVDGDLTIRLSMNKKAQFKSLRPKQLKIAGLQRENSSQSIDSTVLKSVSSATSLSSLPLKSVSSSLSVDSMMGINYDNECIYIYLSFKPTDLKKSSLKANLPQSITITPNLKVYNVLSPYPIPITFDNKYIFNGGLENNNLENMRKKYSFYYQQLVNVLKELETGLARSLYNKINSLARLYSSETTVKKLFESKTINLQNQWKFNENLNIYEAEFQVPLVIDSKNLEKISTFCIPPTFQQCYLTRLYTIDVETIVKRAKNKINMSFPVTVV